MWTASTAEGDQQISRVVSLSSVSDGVSLCPVPRKRQNRTDSSFEIALLPLESRDDPYHGVADLPVGLEREPPFLCWSLLTKGRAHKACGGRRRGHRCKSDGFLRVISQARHCVCPREPHSWLIATQLVGRLGEPLVKRLGSLSASVPSVTFLVVRKPTIATTTVPAKLMRLTPTAMSAIT
jgi:hypothetical protein